MATIRIMLCSEAITQACAWVDTDNDGLVSDEAPVQLDRDGNCWTGMTETNANTVDGVAILWHVKGQENAEFKHRATRVDGDTEFTVNDEGGRLVAAAQRIIRICEDR